jgi:hypothetical protein
MKVRLEDLYLVWLTGANILEESATSIFRVALLQFVSFDKYFGQTSSFVVNSDISENLYYWICNSSSTISRGQEVFLKVLYLLVV